MRHRTTLLLLSPSLFSFFLCGWFYWHSGSSRWSDLCRRLWNQGQWTKLQALAENLDSTGQADVQVLYYAVLAALQAKDQQGLQTLASRLLEKKFFNSRIEQTLVKLLQPTSPVDQLRLFRSRLALALLAVIGSSHLIALKDQRLLVIAAVFSMLLLLLIFIV